MLQDKKCLKALQNVCLSVCLSQILTYQCWYCQMSHGGAVAMFAQIP